MHAQCIIFYLGQKIINSAHLVNVFAYSNFRITSWKLVGMNCKPQIQQQCCSMVGCAFGTAVV